ncbi:MAG: GerW family sporulation protein [Anaerolineae bacterium]
MAARKSETGRLPVEALDTKPAMEAIQGTLTRFLDVANVNRVYGEPIREDEVTIIPTAEVIAGLGFGMGFGAGSGPAEEEKGEHPDEAPTASGGGGGGGGGKTFSRPVAVVVVSHGNVYVEPVVDITKIALATITAAGFMMATLLGFLSPQRMLKQLKGE